MSGSDDQPSRHRQFRIPEKPFDLEEYLDSEESEEEGNQELVVCTTAKQVRSCLKRKRKFVFGLQSYDCWDSSASGIVEALKQDSNLLALSLRSIFINDKDVKAIVESLKYNSCLTRLTLDCRIPRDVVKAIGEMLELNQSLRFLNLTDDQITNKELVPIALALQKNKALQELNLKSNTIGVKGYKLIAKCLRNNSCLQTLRVQAGRSWDDINVYKEVSPTKVRSTRTNRSLKSLTLSHNGMGYRAVDIVGETLKYFPSIKRIDLSANKFGSFGTRKIILALKEHTALQELILDGNSICMKGVRALRDLLVNNHSLKEVSLKVSGGNKSVKKAMALIRSAIDENPYVSRVVKGSRPTKRAKSLVELCCVVLTDSELTLSELKHLLLPELYEICEEYRQLHLLVGQSGYESNSDSDSDL